MMQRRATSVKKVMAKRMENYIKGVLEYCKKNYPGVVYCFDVVNECVDDGTAMIL